MKSLVVLAAVSMAAFAAWKINSGAVQRDEATGEMDASDGDYIAQAEGAAQEFFDGVDSMTGQQNTAAFLAAIRLGEGTSGGDGYYLLCGGGRALDLMTHPALTGWRGWPLPYQMAVNAGFPDGVAVSTAAGAYQITRPTWAGCVRALGLGNFSEASQDAAAVFLIRQKGALADVQAGRTAQAIARLSNVWASLPGAAAKQRQVTIAQFNDKFTQQGGTIA